jgi:hypothetical protein
MIKYSDIVLDYKFNIPQLDYIYNLRINKNKEFYKFIKNNSNYLMNDIIFMIGIGYTINNIYRYKCLFIRDLSNNEQILIINQMINFIKEISRFISHHHCRYRY